MPKMEDVLIAARAKLIASDDFSPLIGVDVGKDAAGGVFTDGWVFQGTGASNNPLRNAANSGKSTVSFNLREHWSSPNNYNTIRLRQLRFTILSDMTRVPGSNALPMIKDAEYRCSRVADAIIEEFHDVANADHIWPGNVFIVSCVLYNDLHISDVPNEDGLVQGDLSFALELG